MDARSDTWASNISADWALTVTKPQSAPLTARALESMDEGALALAALDGRLEAFDELVGRHRRRIYNLCSRFLGNHEDAADATQEAFLRAYRKLPAFKGRSAFGTWLYRIAVNICLNKLSARRRADDVPLDELPESGSKDDALERVIGLQRAHRVRLAVARLPNKQRAALVLRVYQELPHRDIAEILGTSVGAVKANVFHALRNLRRLLGSEP